MSVPSLEVTAVRPWDLVSLSGMAEEGMNTILVSYLDENDGVGHRGTAEGTGKRMMKAVWRRRRKRERCLHTSCKGHFQKRSFQIKYQNSILMNFPLSEVEYIVPCFDSHMSPQ